MYIDDIKLFEKNEKELETLIHTVRIYSQYIGIFPIRQLFNFNSRQLFNLNSQSSNIFILPNIWHNIWLDSSASSELLKENNISKQYFFSNCGCEIRIKKFELNKTIPTNAHLLISKWRKTDKNIWKMWYNACHGSLLWPWLRDCHMCFQVICLSIPSVPMLCLKDPQMGNDNLSRTSSGGRSDSLEQVA